MTEQLTQANRLARTLGIARTWPNLQTIRMAVECEAEYSGVSIAEAADVILLAAREWLRPNLDYRPLEAWEAREFARVNQVDRFWFEDSRWRSKQVYEDFRTRLGAQV